MRGEENRVKRGDERRRLEREMILMAFSSMQRAEDKNRRTDAESRKEQSSSRERRTEGSRKRKKIKID